MIEHFRNSPKLPGRDHLVTENRLAQLNLHRRRPQRVEKKIKKTVAQSRTGLMSCMRLEAEGWLSLNTRWIVSRSPTPCYFHGNAVFVCVYDWAERAELRTLAFFLSHFQPLTSLDLLNPDLSF